MKVSLNIHTIEGKKYILLEDFTENNLGYENTITENLIIDINTI